MSEPVEYPKLDMPQSPEVPNKLPDNIVRADCEGQFHKIPDNVQSGVLPPPPGVARIMIGIPMLAITYEFMESFLKFWTELVISGEKRYEVSYHFAYRRPVHMAEEYLVDIARLNKATHILLMDDDIYDIRKADLDKLFEADKDMISGIMHASKFPHAMCAFRRYNPERKVIDMPVDDSMYRLYEIPCTCKKCGTGISHWDAKFCIICGEPQDNLVQPVDLVPFPFTLMKLSLFDKLKQPWFHCTTKYPSDSWFCDRMLEAGLTPYAHMGVRLNHAGVTDATKPHYVQMGMIKAQQSKAIVQLTPDQMDIHQKLLMDKMKETENKLKAKPVFIMDGKPTANEINKEEYTLVTHGR